MSETEKFRFRGEEVTRTESQRVKEVVVVRDHRVERLFLGCGSVRYEGWSSLRSYFNEARAALVAETLGGKAPVLREIPAQCTDLVRRRDHINSPLREERASVVYVAHPPQLPETRLGLLKIALDGQLHRFAQAAKTPHFTPTAFHVWRPGFLREGAYPGKVTEAGHRWHMLPQSWLGEFRGEILWARQATTTGNVFVIRRRGLRALVADSNSKLWVGTLKPHHRKMHFTMEDEGLWDSLLAD